MYRNRTPNLKTVKEKEPLADPKALLLFSLGFTRSLSAYNCVSDHVQNCCILIVHP